MQDSQESRETLARTRDLVEKIFVSDAPASQRQIENLVVHMNELIESEGVDLGQCRLAPEYAKLKFVLTEAGLQICCTHAPPHCSPFTR